MGLIITLFFLVGAFLYFLPTVLVLGKKQVFTVLIINVFFGWSIIGWIVALVISLKN